MPPINRRRAHCQFHARRAAESPKEAQAALARLLEQEEVTRFSGAIATPNVDAALNDLNCVLRALK